jgi:hypothetical protein
MSKTNNGLGVYPGGSFSRSLGYVVMRRKMYRSQVRGGISASALTTTPTYANPVDLSAYTEALIILTASATVSGAPAGVKLYCQITDYLGNFSDHPDFIGGVAITPTVTIGILAVLKATNLGDMVRIGVSATTAWAGGTIALGIKAKS